MKGFDVSSHPGQSRPPPASTSPVHQPVRTREAPDGLLEYPLIPALP